MAFFRLRSWGRDFEFLRRATRYRRIFCVTTTWPVVPCSFDGYCISAAAPLLRLSTCPSIVDFIRHLLTNSRQFEKLLFDEGVFGGFLQIADIRLLVLGDNLNSACDNAPPNKQTDARYAIFSVNMPPLRISFNTSSGRSRADRSEIHATDFGRSVACRAAGAGKKAGGDPPAPPPNNGWATLTEHSGATALHIQ